MDWRAINRRDASLGEESQRLYSDGSTGTTNHLFSIAFAVLLVAALTQTGCIALTGPPVNSSTNKLRSSNTNSDNGQLIANPASLDFGSVAIGTSNTSGLALTNTGATNATISNVSVSGPGFDATGIPTGLILAPGDSATLNVTFSPSASASVTGTVTVTSDATNSSITISLSGSGTSSAAHSVSLSWNSSTSSVIGYNIYRSGSSAGPYAKLNALVNGTTGFTDTTVQEGQTYYYAVTSVDTDNLESSFSELASVSIPTP